MMIDTAEEFSSAGPRVPCWIGRTCTPYRPIVSASGSSARSALCRGSGKHHVHGHHYGDNDAAWSTVLPLPAIVARNESRPAGADVTLFKSLGLGLSDLAMGLLAHERTVATGSGTPLPPYVGHADLDFSPADYKEQL